MAKAPERIYVTKDDKITVYENNLVTLTLEDGTVHDPVEGQCFQRMCVPCARSVLMEACSRIVKAFEDVL